MSNLDTMGINYPVIQPQYHSLETSTPHNYDNDNNTFVGDILNENKPENITRIYTQNLNGIKWDKDGGNWPFICESMAAIHADISCFTEINLDANNNKIHSKMRQIEK